MVRWYHAIFSAYGFWLPNDPRGSWSDFVGAYELYRHGHATTTSAKHSLAATPHDRASRLAGKAVLKHPPVRFTADQLGCIASGIEQACTESEIALHALAIGFDHVHAIVGRHEKSVEQVVQHFKSRATKRMRAEGCHPMRASSHRDGTLPSPWADSCWSVFINDRDQLSSTIAYVERHPLKEGLPPQRWSFLSPPV